jgi:ketosteroid isomerase-like protein
MTDQNADIVRHFYVQLSKDDHDSALTVIDPEMEFDWSESRAPWRGVYHGHQGMRRLWDEQHEAWENFQLELVEAIEIDAERVVTVTRVHALGKGSGIKIEASGALLWTLRDRLITSGKFFQGREEALAAARAPVQEARD